MIRITRAEFLASLAAMPLTLAFWTDAAPAASDGAELRRADVPFDHARPSDGSFELDYFLAAPFQPRRPTVLVLGDGQQFYIRQDVWHTWRQRFGPDVNVVGIAGRGFAPGLQARVGAPDGEAWLEAYRLLRYEQWADDVDAVRRDLVGPEGQVLLYGASGGGRLVHEYLSRHGRHVSRAMTQAAPFTYLDAEFGLSSDRFWEELGEADRVALTTLLDRQPQQREFYAHLFQRQNFFVDPARLAEARRALVADLVAGREAAIAQRRQDYQVDIVNQLIASPAGTGIRVRMFEFIAPLAERLASRRRTFSPDHEVSERVGRPLLALQRQGRIAPPQVALAALHRLETEVLMVAAHGDHTVDYRAQIGLASCYPHRRLLIFDDNHTFDRLAAVPERRDRFRAAWVKGLASPEMAAATAELAPLLWRES